MSESPLFSIITVTFNSAATVQNTIDSIRQQECNDFEHVVIDGGSTDDTTDIVRQNARNLSVLVSERDHGIYDAMNKGLSRCRGTYVYYLNGDDALSDKHVLSSVADALHARGNTPPVISGPVCIDYGAYQVISNAPYSRENLTRAVMPPHQGLFIRREFMQSVGGFDTKFKSSGDLDLLVRALTLDPEVLYLDKVIARMQAGGMSSRKRISYRETARLLREHFGRVAAARYTLRKIYGEQLVKRILERVLPARSFMLLRRRYLDRS